MSSTTSTPATTDTPDRQRSGNAVIRFGAVALPLGLITAFAATAIHPHREDPMNDPAVFTEYAQDSDWIVVHFAQWAGSLLLFAGLLGVYYAIRPRTGPGSGPARLGLAATGQATAAITALQVVDGVALKWAVDAWVAGPEGADKTAAFAAAQALRWTEYAFQSYSNILLGLAVGLYGLAIARGTGYPRWLGYLAIGSATAWITHGLLVAHIGLFDSIPRLIAQVLLVVFTAGIAPLMWRRSRPQSTTDRHDHGTGSRSQILMEARSMVPRKV
jgi:hypothetical protein